MHFQLIIRKTYVAAGLETLGLNRIVVEPLPFLKGSSRKCVVLLSVPAQQIRVVRNTDAFAIPLDHLSRVIEHLVCIYDANLNAALFRMVAIHTIAGCRMSCSVGDPARCGHTRPHDVDLAEVVKNTADLIVAGFRWRKVVKAGDIVQRWDGASVVGRDAIVGIADEKGEMEKRQKLGGHHGWVSRLGFCVVRVGSPLPRRLPRDAHAVNSCSIGAINPVGVTVGLAIDMAIGADSALQFQQRRSNACWLSVRGDEIVNDVFDEDSLALYIDRVSSKSQMKLARNASEANIAMP